jgi:hypothetical protein
MQARDWAAGSIGLILAGVLSGCGSGNNMVPSGGTPITLTFAGGTPTAVATQTGNGTFTAMTPGSQITFTLPQGTSTYAIAYACPPFSGVTVTITEEHVIEVSTQDNVQPHLLCAGGGAPTTGAATGSASSAISGTAGIEIVGKNGLGLKHGSFTSGPFSVNLPVGTNDVALIAVDASDLILGTKILRAQTVPGVLNGGSGIIIGPADAVVPQSVTVNNVAAGFTTPGISAAYFTANGTSIGLVRSATLTNPQTYFAINPADAQAGDFYGYSAVTINPGAGQVVSIVQTTTSGGGPVTLTLPAPWNFSGPTPAKLPTFTFDYSGFSGQPAIANFASINWTTASASSRIDVTATARFLNGANTITLPDLSGLPGFITPAASGTTINWGSTIFGGTGGPSSLGGTSSNSAVGLVTNVGHYTQP